MPRIRSAVTTWTVAAISAAVYALHGFDGLLTRDLAIYAYGGQRMVDGVPPYVGILERTGPLAQMVPALGVAVGRLLDVDDLLAIRQLFLLISVACVVLVFLVARSWFSSTGVGLAAAATFLAFPGFIRLATNGPREKTTMVLFLLLLLLSVARRWWYLAGAAASLAALTWQPAVLVAAAALVLPIAGLRGADRSAAALRMLIGGLGPLVVVGAYFLTTGAFQDFLDGFVLINLRSTTARSRPLVGVWAVLRNGYGLAAWTVPIGILALAAKAGAQLRRTGLRPALVHPTVVTSVASLPAVLWTAHDIDAWADAFVLLPFAALGMAVIFEALRQRLSPRLGAVATIAWVLIGLAAATSFAMLHRDTSLVRQREAVRHMLRQVPDASILSVQAPQVLVLSGRTNPLRHQMFQGGITEHIHATWPGGLELLIADVRTEPPDLIAWQTRYEGRAGGLRALLRSDYVQAGLAPGWTWYVHESVAAGVVDVSPDTARGQALARSTRERSPPGVHSLLHRGACLLRPPKVFRCP